jgi:hypothetical protein
MGASAIGRVTEGVRTLSAAIGVAAAVGMGAMSFTHVTDVAGASAARTDDLPSATVTRSTAPKELATSFARPTHTAKPCAARATLPC